MRKFTWLVVLAALSLVTTTPLAAKDRRANGVTRAEKPDVWFWYDQAGKYRRDVTIPVIRAAATWLTRKQWEDIVYGHGAAKKHR